MYLILAVVILLISGIMLVRDVIDWGGVRPSKDSLGFILLVLAAILVSIYFISHITFTP